MFSIMNEWKKWKLGECCNLTSLLIAEKRKRTTEGEANPADTPRNGDAKKRKRDSEAPAVDTPMDGDQADDAESSKQEEQKPQKFKVLSNLKRF